MVEKKKRGEVSRSIIWLMHLIISFICMLWPTTWDSPFALNCASKAEGNALLQQCRCLAPREKPSFPNGIEEYILHAVAYKITVHYPKAKHFTSVAEWYTPAFLGSKLGLAWQGTAG